MGKIINKIKSETNYDKNFLKFLLSRFEAIKIQGGSVKYASEKNCFLLELILSDTTKIKVIIPTGRTDYLSFAIFEYEDMKIANHLTLD